MRHTGDDPCLTAVGSVAAAFVMQKAVLGAMLRTLGRRRTRIAALATLAFAVVNAPFVAWCGR